MFKNKNLIVILSTFLIVLGVIFGSIYTNFSAEISTIVTTITAIIGAVALWIQFKKDREINQSSFILEFHKSFGEDDDSNKVLAEIHKKFNGQEYTPLKDMRKELIEYLYWIRTLCNLIERNVLTFQTIDELFSYRFFSITDNKEVQELELVAFPYLYKTVYRVYRRWTEYRKKNGLINDVYNDESLSLVKDYDVLSK